MHFYGVRKGPFAKVRLLLVLKNNYVAALKQKLYTFKQHVAALAQLSKTLRCAEFALKRQRVL